MLDILRKFFRFCDERERKEFYISIGLGVAAAIFSAMKIPAIGVMLQAILNGAVTTKAILLSFVIMLVSVVGSSLLKYKATALQTDGGYSTTANKRVQIAEHLRYLPMYPIEYFFFNPGFCTIPLNNFLAMLYIDRTWTTIQS